jgi:integrase-like protein
MPDATPIARTRRLRLPRSLSLRNPSSPSSKGRWSAPKSHHGKREVPLPATLAAKLTHWRTVTEWGADEDLVFPTTTGQPLNDSNLRNRVLRAVVEEIGAPWATLHTFRHTFASLELSRGTNVLRVSRLLGHHDASFTLRVYAHLMEDDAVDALDLTAELPRAEEAIDAASEAIGVNSDVNKLIPTQPDSAGVAGAGIA